MSKDNQEIILINVFRVEPQQQQQLIDIMIRAVEQTVRYQPGFLSARLHRGLDGTLVANYVQWRSKEDLDRMRETPEMQQHIAEIHTITKGNAQLFELCNVTEGSPENASTPQIQNARRDAVA